MVTRPKQGQGASRSTNGKKGPKPWQPLTSEMQHIVFDYDVQMKPAQFKSNVSKIFLLLKESLKCGDPEVKKAIRLGVGPMLTKPTESELKEIHEKEANRD